MVKEIFSKSGKKFIFRKLSGEDSAHLGKYFEYLSVETRSKYGPHPLTTAHAELLCANIGKDRAERFVIFDANEIIGYMILDFNYYEHDTARYKTYGISLDPQLDPMFAPCMADRFQNYGIAGSAMHYLLQYAKERSLRSIVLMGGTQEPNKLAQSFYLKYGFKEYGRFYTEYNKLDNIDMRLVL